MLNNFLTTWLLLFILIIIIFNIILRVYKFYLLRFLYSYNVETFIDLNGVNLITYITFKCIYDSPFLKWKSIDNYLNLVRAVLYILNEDNNPFVKIEFAIA